MVDVVQIQTGCSVNVRITSNISSLESERRFQRDLTILNLKGKLELQTGVQCGNMQLQVYSKDNKLICSLDNDNALLGSYPVDDECRIHVESKDGSQIADFEDLSKVEKFELSQDEYDKRTDSVKAFKERNKIGRFNEQLVEEKRKRDEEKAQYEEQLISQIEIGNRCEVKVPGNPTRRGTVQYKGKTDFSSGLWIGVQYDEPLGKNNGSVKGKSYFTCPDKYGGFVRPSQVTIGDFPEEFDIDMEDEI